MTARSEELDHVFVRKLHHSHPRKQSAADRQKRLPKSNKEYDSKKSFAGSLGETRCDWVKI